MLYRQARLTFLNRTGSCLLGASLLHALSVTPPETPACAIEGLQRLVRFLMSRGLTCNSFTSVPDYTVQGSGSSNHWISRPYEREKPSAAVKRPLKFRRISVHGQFPPCVWKAKQLEWRLHLVLTRS